MVKNRRGKQRRRKYAEQHQFPLADATRQLREQREPHATPATEQVPQPNLHLIIESLLDQSESEERVDNTTVTMITTANVRGAQNKTSTTIPSWIEPADTTSMQGKTDPLLLYAAAEVLRLTQADDAYDCVILDLDPSGAISPETRHSMKNSPAAAAITHVVHAAGSDNAQDVAAWLQKQHNITLSPPQHAALAMLLRDPALRTDASDVRAPEADSFRRTLMAIVNDIVELMVMGRVHHRVAKQPAAE